MAAKLTGPEVLEEVEWFLGARVHPELISDTLHRKPAAIEKLARTYGRIDIARVFDSLRDRRGGAR